MARTRIIHCAANSVNELNSCMMRIQEFYESPFEDIRGRFFTVNDYKKSYKKHTRRKFDYLSHWIGNNIPGYNIRSFYETYLNERLSPFELRLKRYLRAHGLLDSTKKFYIIASIESSAGFTLPHELCHAFYYLHPKYKQRMDRYIRLFSDKFYDNARKVLLKLEYTESVLHDEMQAYFGTECIGIMLSRFHVKIADVDWKTIAAMQSYVVEFINDKLPDNNFW